MEPIKVATLTTVFQRLETTLFHMHYMKWMRDVYNTSQQLHIHPFYVLSDYDPYLRTYIDELTRLKMDFVSLPYTKLSTKAQYGLWALEQREFDYLMHLDSDEIVPMNLLGHWKPRMEKGATCFGCTKRIFYVPDTGIAYLFGGYNRHPVVNGGFCIKRTVLDNMSWYMWTPGLDFGLNVNQHIRLKSAGYTVEKHDMGLMSPVEIKQNHEEQLHPLDWYFEEDYKLEELDEKQLRTLHTYHFKKLHNYSNVSWS